MQFPDCSRYVISVLIGDRSGILKDVTTTVTAMHGNIDAIRQSVVAGYFTVMLTASFDQACKADTIKTRMEQTFNSEEASVTVVSYDASLARPVIAGERYMVTLTGEDHTGILKTVTAFFAERNINIEDWDVEFEGSRITHVGMITVPRKLDIKQLQIEFRHAAETLALHSGIQHENIFKAISEVGPIKLLLSHS